MLERLGCQVTARTSSVKALETFRDSFGKFDLVITDMTMPNMTGVQLSQKLLEIRPDIPIIICTDISTKIDNEKAKTAGGYEGDRKKNTRSAGERLKNLLFGNYSQPGDNCNVSPTQCIN